MDRQKVCQRQRSALWEHVCELLERGQLTACSNGCFLVQYLKDCFTDASLSSAEAVAIECIRPSDALQDLAHSTCDDSEHGCKLTPTPTHNLLPVFAANEDFEPGERVRVQWLQKPRQFGCTSLQKASAEVDVTAIEQKHDTPFPHDSTE